MCGICGVLALEDDQRIPVDHATLDRMTDAMTHRGPNERGTYLAPGIALGARRLSIVDVAEGHQPATSEDGRIRAIQNGELYNHLELRQQLGPHHYASRCDTEVLPHAYEELGPVFPERLRGKFAIAVWSEERRQLVLARDRLGVKPLYFAECDGLLLFASELKSLLASGLVPTDLDYEGIDAYLTFGFTPAPRTLLKAVSKLKPGHRLIADIGGGFTVEPYWTYPDPNPTPGVSEAEWRHGLLETLEESVRLRLMSDVPLGAMLSGGLDSSLVVALMAKNMSEPVKTFSVGFTEEGAANELADARFVAEYYGTDHHELELSMFDDTVDTAELVWALDEPVADLSSLGLLSLSQLAAQHVTVALSGQGADELFGGYPKHVAAGLLRTASTVPLGQQVLGAVAGRLPGDKARRFAASAKAGDAADRVLAMSGMVDVTLAQRLYRGPLAEVAGQEPRRLVRALAPTMRDKDALAEVLHIDGQLALPDDMLHYFDRTSMAHSLEVRVPFLDHKVVEYSARIPTNLKVRRRTTKYILKNASRGLVPEQIIDKQKIGFFHASIGDWFTAQTAGAISDYLLASDLRCADFLDQDEIQRLVERHRTNPAASVSRLLLAILLLEAWLSDFLPKALASALVETR
jgi:asparagine synthase (glutamine-hydrolysing)